MPARPEPRPAALAAGEPPRGDLKPQPDGLHRPGLVESRRARSSPATTPNDATIRLAGACASSAMRACCAPLRPADAWAAC
jgi:hypothetical protein